MTPSQKTNDLGPALVLMLLSPLLTEVLPGATRFSSIFVLPVEICVWGGGALLIRYAVRRWQLGWINMLFLALALSLAEECVIQQTSLAPLVIRLKGETYARAFGVNYVYLLWALIYESVFVVFLPIYLVEFIFPGRRERLWISKAGFFVLIPFFVLACFVAWFSWTRIARTKVFHVPVYNPPLPAVILSLLLIFGFVYAGLASRPVSSAPLSTRVQKLPPPVLLVILGIGWATSLYGLVLLGFGIAPHFPVLVALLAGIVLSWLPIYLLPRWTSAQNWRSKHRFALIFGVAVGAMLAGFIGFIGTTGPDLYFKIVVNVIAVVLLVLLGRKTIKPNVNHATG